MTDLRIGRSELFFRECRSDLIHQRLSQVSQGGAFTGLNEGFDGHSGHWCHIAEPLPFTL